ncbi:Fe(3+) dicitrate ABC transporter ATP-binding protein FecE [Yersinia frederiksenii]|uniref:Fe(3+) dicitrate ABC transporter ATP-binding protein FecE n=1 Tax=Yersinia frederiksenii TaxID=29484 RepID=UPI0005DEFBEA|nr:Fe(3+) dicitrate ABC transporter ATP-binding protein FecE [Yersinia frederiksenii]CQH53489.1 iron-siderophore ABC transporter ATP-binding [Yersinia frederiksenii]
MILNADNLYAGYGNRSILKGISLQLPANKITALVGPNGCGKSTLLKCFSRLVTPSSGQITCNGQDIISLSMRALAQGSALLPQQHVIPEGIDVEELVSYGRSPWLGVWGRLSRADRRLIKQAMEDAHIIEFAKTRVSELSGGQRQRAFLAMTLAQNTPMILLDEPTTYLDINHQAELMALLRRLNLQGKTLITVLHDLNQASRYCDHLVMMSAGSIVAEGTPEEVITPENLKQVFGVEAEIHPDPVSGTPMCIIL